MLLLKLWISEAHLEAIAAMLFHSIWQGALLAAAAGIILLVTKKASAVLRYNLLIMSLFVFATSAVYTYWTHLSGGVSDISSAVGEITVLKDQQQQSQQPGSINVINSIMTLFDAHASLIVFCWVLLIFARVCFILTGYYTAHRFVTRELVPVTHEWQQRWTSLMEKMNIAAKIQLMESALAKVPMVIGHFKPLVLVPAGMLMSLPPDQAEAILLHELAHIKRRDHVLNLVQQGIQCIFFFHPAIAWVCSLINEEREHCCDDVAARYNGDKHTYINALVSFYEHMLPPIAVLGFSGRKRCMTDRIKRLIHHQNKTLNIMEKIFLTVALVVAGFVLQAYYHNGTNVNTNLTHQITDTIPQGKVEMSWTEDDKKFRAVFRNNELDELYVDGKRIPRERYNEYQQVLDRMNNNRQEAEEDAARAREDAEEARRAAEEDRKEAMKEASRAKEEHKKAKVDHAEINLNKKDLEKIVQDALEEAGKALRELQMDEDTYKKLDEDLQGALRAAQEGLKEAQIELREAQKNRGSHQEDITGLADDEVLSEITGEALKLALNAAKLGLRDANVELQATLHEEQSEKIDKKEYRERKKKLREAYRDSQRTRD